MTSRRSPRAGSGVGAVPSHFTGGGPQSPWGLRPFFRLRFQLFGKVNRKPNMGNRGELPLKVINVLF